MPHRAVLHIEDDPSLANLVKMTFESFGFQGEILQTGSVEEALTLILDRESKKLPVDLILSDMHLPDGKGLDILQYIKASPTWSKTPVIILSGETSSEMISEAYALGANCYLSKFPIKGKGIEHFRSLYQFWIENALIPRVNFVSGIQDVLSKAIHLRARTAKFYIDQSKARHPNPDLETFWFERAMVEGNLSSLLTFLQDLIGENDLPPELIDRFSTMQTKVEKAILKAELENSGQNNDKEPDLCHAVLGLVEAWDEELFAEAFGFIAPLNESVSLALKSRSALQLNEIANFVLQASADAELIKRAESLQEFSSRLRCMPLQAQPHSP